MKSQHQDNAGPSEAASAKKSGETVVKSGATGDPSISQASLLADSHVAKRLPQNHQEDIICGRGLHITCHSGNQKLHRIVSRHRLIYQSAVRREKVAITNWIVDEIKKSGSRFIRKVENGREDEWEEVDDKTAYEKVGHALRLRRNTQPPPSTGESGRDRSISQASLISGAREAKRLSENAGDIICGRGKHIWNHIGNQQLHRIANRHRLTYHSATRSEKASIIQRIVDDIKSSGVRFIRKVASVADDEWEEVDNETAYNKVGHALRLRQHQHPKRKQKEISSQTTQVDALNHGLSVGSFDRTVSAALGRIDGTLSLAPHNRIVHVPSILPPTYWPGPLHLRDRFFFHGMGMALASRSLVDHPRMNLSVASPLADPYGHFLINPLFPSVFNATQLATVWHASMQSQVAVRQGAVSQELPADNGRSHPKAGGMR